MWSIENGVAVYRGLAFSQHFNKRSIEKAIKTVVSQEKWFVTPEAYQAELSRLKEGRDLFNDCPANRKEL